VQHEIQLIKDVVVHSPHLKNLLLTPAQKNNQNEVKNTKATLGNVINHRV
jgi:hypothetical protein